MRISQRTEAAPRRSAMRQWAERVVTVPAEMVGKAFSLIPSTAAAVVADGHADRPKRIAGAYVAASVAQNMLVGATVGSVAGPAGALVGAAAGMVDAVTTKCSGQLQEVVTVVQENAAHNGTTRTAKAAMNASGRMYADYARGLTLGAVDGVKGIARLWRERPREEAAPVEGWRDRAASVGEAVAGAVGAAAMTVPGMAHGFLESRGGQKVESKAILGAVAAGAGLAFLGLPGLVVGGGVGVALCVASKCMHRTPLGEAVEGAVSDLHEQAPQASRPIEAAWKERIQGALVGGGAAALEGKERASSMMHRLLQR